MEWANVKEYEQWHTARVQRSTQFKTEAKRIQDDLTGFGLRLVAFGDKAEAFFATPDNIGKDFRAFTVRVNEEMARVELAIAAITATLDASLHLGEGVKKTIQLHDRAKASLDSAFKSKDKGEKESKRYAEFLRQHNDISEQLKSEVSLLRDSEERHSSGKFRQLLVVQRDTLRRLAELAETLCTQEQLGGGGPSATMMAGGVGAGGPMATAGGSMTSAGARGIIDKGGLPAPPVLGTADAERMSDKAMLPPPPALATADGGPGGMPGAGAGIAKPIQPMPPMQPLQTSAAVTAPAAGETLAARQG